VTDNTWKKWKRKMNEKWKKKEVYYNVFFKRESSIHRSTENETSEVTLGHLIPLLSLTYISLYIPIRGNHIFSTFFIPHTTLGQSRFICTLVIPFCHLTKTSNPSHNSYHKNWGSCKAYFPSWRVLYTTVIFFLNQVVHTSKLKAHIDSPTHQNWDT